MDVVTTLTTPYVPLVVDTCQAARQPGMPNKPRIGRDTVLDDRRKIMTEPKQESVLARPLARFTDVPPVRALTLPLIFTLILFAFGLLPSARQNPKLLWSFWGAGAALLVWNAALLGTAFRLGRTLSLEVVLRNQHYVQACAQLSIFVYWGWYWRQVYDSAELIVAQLVFAYAFDALLTWSRRSSYTLGFGPFPIIFSTNLFLWFRPDWFFLQFLLVAVGFAAKELIRWNKEGRRTHIFNPSSFPLALFSMVLILTGTTHLTWGQEIAFTQLFPPYIYVWIFLASLPGQFLFGVTLMTMSAVATAYTLALLYVAATGDDYFFGTFIPIASFLGMHLLFNDPSTSPRTELGRIMFGMLYGSSIVALYGLLGLAGTPTFYDKLLAVPILNMMIQGIDRIARSNALKRFDPTSLLVGLAPRRRYLVYISAWTVIFVVMQFLSSTDQNHARHHKLGITLMDQGQAKEAISHFREVVRIQPGEVTGHNNLGFALVNAGRYEDAVAPLQRALEMEPNKPRTHYMLALALSKVDQPRAAVHHYHEAIRMRPEWSRALAVLAWLRATHPDADVRDSGEAVDLATRASELTGRRDPTILETLAEAYAAAGQFEEAVRTAEEAEALYPAGSEADLNGLKANLKRYRAGQYDAEEEKEISPASGDPE